MKRIGTTPEGKAIFEDERGNQFVGGYQPTEAPVNIVPPKVSLTTKPKEDELVTFVALVRSMRDSQKRYFKTRDYNAMLDSKRFEGMVDKWISEFDKRKVCPDLFQGADLPF